MPSTTKASNVDTVDPSPGHRTHFRRSAHQWLAAIRDCGGYMKNHMLTGLPAAFITLHRRSASTTVASAWQMISLLFALRVPLQCASRKPRF
jgi:hypothetical protein